MIRHVLSAIAILTLAGCGGPMSLDDAEVNEVCQHVNDQNWHSPVWNHSAREECEQSHMNIADEQVPCTFGGLPGWCRLDSSGSAIGYHRGISTNWMDISPTEKSLTDGHLVILSGC
ncbi:hypothetical protein HY626_00120 [Candidatus Uhrbacteria bacterium]|nr:hypothetical protein [Candidatus Uhrbacteria bacterium]